MADGRVENGPDGTVAFIKHPGLAALQSGGINAEMQEGLGRGLLQEIPGGRTVHPVEELIVLTGYDGGVPVTEHIVESAAVIFVNRIVGNQQGGGDQPVAVLQHRLPAGQSAVGVTRDADLAAVHKGQGGQVLDAVVQAVGVVFVIPPAAGGNRLRVAVAVHADGQHHITPAGILHIV